MSDRKRFLQMQYDHAVGVLDSMRRQRRYLEEDIWDTLQNIQEIRREMYKTDKEEKIFKQIESEHSEI